MVLQPFPVDNNKIGWSTMALTRNETAIHLLILSKRDFIILSITTRSTMISERFLIFIIVAELLNISSTTKISMMWSLSLRRNLVQFYVGDKNTAWRCLHCISYHNITHVTNKPELNRSNKGLECDRDDAMVIKTLNRANNGLVVILRWRKKRTMMVPDQCSAAISQRAASHLNKEDQLALRYLNSSLLPLLIAINKGGSLSVCCSCPRC